MRAGANNINGISFDVENRMDAETQARKLAVEDARRKAQELAEASGVALAELQSINVYSSGTPTGVHVRRQGRDHGSQYRPDCCRSNGGYC